MGYRDEDPLFRIQRHYNFRGLIIILLIVLILTVSAMLVNAFINRQVQSQSYYVTIPSLPSSLQGFRILHISDLHGSVFGEGQEGISAAMKNLKYDIVVLSGDMTAPDGSFDGLISLLDLIDSNTPVFLISGDEDPAAIQSTVRISNQVKAEYILAAEKRGAVYLDAPYLLNVGKTNLWLCPEYIYSTDIDSTEHTVRYNLDMLENQPATEDIEASRRAVSYMLERFGRIREALKSMKSEDVKICVTHIPYTQERIQELLYNPESSLNNNATPVSLVLAGHYNAGQCRLPFLGPVYVPAKLGIYSENRWFPGDHHLSGLYTIRGITQHVSPGLGSARIYSPFSWRFFNSPSITLLTLTSKLVSQ